MARLNARLGGGGGEVGDYSAYRDDPAGFIEGVLKLQLTEQQRRFCEAVHDHRAVVAQSANATGKSFVVAALCVWVFKCLPQPQVYVLAAPPEGNLRRILWGHVLALVERRPEVFKGDTRKDLLIQRNPLEFIAGVAIPQAGDDAQREARVSGKHAPTLFFCIDEADAVPDAIFRGIESCASGGDVRIVCTFNPRQPAGWVYRMIRDGRAHVVRLSAFDHPNVVTGENIVPGAVTREVTVRRINEWTRPLAEGEAPGEGDFELPAFLEGAVARSQSGQAYPPLKPGWYRIEQPEFSYMVLGEYPSQGSTQLISREWIARARSRWDAYVAKHGEAPPAGASAVAGVDVAEFGSDSNVLCLRCGGFVPRLISWAGMDVLATADRVLAECSGRAVSRVNVDATGVGAGVAPHLTRKGCVASPVKTASAPTEKSELGEFQLLRDQLWWAVREWLRTDPGAMLPPDEFLLEELLVPTYEIASGKIRVMKKDVMRELLKRSPDRADALCLTFYEPELLFPAFAA